jgi:hypothetical protein
MLLTSQLLALLIVLTLLAKTIQGSEFREQSVFTGRYCLKHKQRSWTDSGVNYRLDASGAQVSRNVTSVMNQRLGFGECREQCGVNPDCIGYAHRARDELCQWITHCDLTTTGDSNFRYFVKEIFGCHKLVVREGLECVGTTPILSKNDTVVRVQDCLELCKLNDCTAFTIDHNMACRVYEGCANRVGNPTSTVFQLE